MLHATRLNPAAEDPDVALAEQARAAFVNFYRGNTRHSYEYDLRVLFAWCAREHIPVMRATRSQLEQFARYCMEERGNGSSTLRRRMATVRQFYRLAAADDLIPKSPAEFMRLPRDARPAEEYDGLTHLELAALIATARRSTPTEWALVVVMAMLGLRVSEACDLTVDQAFGIENGHRVLRFVGKGNKPAVIPLPVPVARAIDAAIGDRRTGPLLLRRDATPMNRRSASRVITRLARQAGITKKVFPHLLRHSYITALLDAGVQPREAQVAARHAQLDTTMGYDRHRKNLDRHGVYAVAAFLSDSGADGTTPLLHAVSDLS